MRLEGKIALITGGARGQGAAEARVFAKEGAKVVITDVLDSDGEKLAAEIGESGGDALFIHLEVTSEEQWQSAIAETVLRFGKLDVLVNNAAIWRRGIVEETTSDHWDAIMDVNAKGVFLGTKLVIPEMRKVGGGSIINISSVAGLVGSLTSSAYSASKGAVRLLTKSTAIQYAGEGIRANSIHPGYARTPMTEASFSQPENYQLRVVRVPMGKMASADDIAWGIVYLACDESAYVTGSELVIDGGLTAQ